MGLEQVYWSLPIVAYPFVSGLVAGSFIIGSLARVFHQQRFEVIAKMSLLVTLAFLLFAPLGPLADSRQPSRWYEMFTRMHIPYAPMGLFTLIWLLYVLVVLVEIYVTFRPDNIRLGAALPGWRGLLHRVLALGSAALGEGRRHREDRLLTGLAVTGIVLAFAFHGYIGFIFGAFKARPLWGNPLMIPLFIVSAIVSGIALMILAYTFIFKWFSLRRVVDRALIEDLMVLLMWVLLIDLFLDLVDVLNTGPSVYASASVSEGFSSIFLHGPVGPVLGYLIGQIGLLLVALIFTFIGPARRSVAAACVTAVVTLVSVWFMRFNTVIGAQLQPKVSQGLVYFQINWLGRDSLQVVVGYFLLILFVLGVLLAVFPWDDASTARTLQQVGRPGSRSGSAHGAEERHVPGTMGMGVRK